MAHRLELSWHATFITVKCVQCGCGTSILFAVWCEWYENLRKRCDFKTALDPHDRGDGGERERHRLRLSETSHSHTGAAARARTPEADLTNLRNPKPPHVRYFHLRYLYCTTATARLSPPRPRPRADEGVRAPAFRSGAGRKSHGTHGQQLLLHHARPGRPPQRRHDLETHAVYAGA
jgi:hypothetical protein